MNLSGSELIIVLLAAVAIFGPAQLPKLARSVGQAQREFHRGVNQRGEPDRSPKGPVNMPAPTASADEP